MYDSVVPYILIGAGSDPTAAQDVSSVLGSFLAMSNPYQLFDAYYDIDNLASYEGDGIPTAVSTGMIAPPLGRITAPPYVGVWSAEISDASGDISWNLTIVLNNSHKTAFSFYMVGDATGTVYYFLGDSLAYESAFATDGGVFRDSTERTFDKVILSFGHLSAPYTHVKLTEIEFGSFRTISNADLTETINVIKEVDLLESSMPIDEVDFSLINTDGKYDTDNLDATGHNKALDDVAIGTPIALAFVFTEGSTKTVSVMGRYIIIKHDADEETLRITAQDPRTVLQSKTLPIKINMSKTIAASISTVLTAVSIPHVVDESASTVYPIWDYDFSDEVNTLDQLLFIQQRYDIYTVPGDDGLIHIRKGIDTPSEATLTQDWMISYPKPSYSDTYNYISVSYGDADNREYHNKDLREDTSSTVYPFTVDNPLVRTLEEAQNLAERVAGNMYIQRYSAEAIGDIGIVPRRTVGIEGRHSAGAPLKYRMQTVEFEYNGAFIMRLEGAR